MGSQGGTSRVNLRPLVTAALACGALLVSVPTASADEAEWLYDPNTVVEVDLGLGQAEIEALEDVPDKYVKGTFEAKVGGARRGPALTEVGIRLKGSLGSFRKLSRKAAFKVKFDKFVDGQLYHGLEGITLNNMVQDPSMLHEALTYDLFRAMGVPAPRTGYAFTRLNGEVFGVHANIEQYDDVSLRVLFGSTRHLYEADAANVDVYPGGAQDFEVDEGDDEDLGDLEALIAAANDGVGDWSDGMEAVADLEEMTRMWAVERYVGHWDGYAGTVDPPGRELRPNNYYLHSDENGVFQMAPWGTDQTWQNHLGFTEPAGGLMFNKCLADASCAALYDDALADIQDLAPTLELPAKARRYAALLAPCQALEAEPRREHSPAQIAAAVGVAEAFIDERHIPLDEYLGRPSPSNFPETANPPTQEPCSPRTPDGPAGAPGGGQPNVCAMASRSCGGVGWRRPTPRLKVGRSRLIGSRVVTAIRVPSAGRVSQRVRAKSKGRWRTACVGTRRARSAGPLRVACRLAGWARSLAADGALRPRVRVGFHPREGRAKFLDRRLTLAKLD